MTINLLKALHLIAMVGWFAGLFYLFRLFVYHVENKHNKDITSVFEKMEYRLYYYITVPAMIVTLVVGILMLSDNPSYLKMGWIQAKLFFSDVF